MQKMIIPFLALIVLMVSNKTLAFLDKYLKGDGFMPNKKNDQLCLFSLLRNN